MKKLDKQIKEFEELMRRYPNHVGYAKTLIELRKQRKELAAKIGT